MRILVIPDMHQPSNLEAVETAIAREKPDETVFLGDYFDQFGDTPEQAERTATWLKASLAHQDRTHLWGNHDASYGFGHEKGQVCSGFSSAKLRRISAILGPAEWGQLRLVHWRENLLFSHAGWSREHCPDGVGDATPERLRQYLIAEEARAWACLDGGAGHWIFEAGRLRGGSQPVGGLLWCDFREFKAIDGLHQIFGHTPGNAAAVKRGRRSVNICLDTCDFVEGVRHYLLVTLNPTLVVPTLVVDLKTMLGKRVNRIRA